jgi:adiponectin receptor
MLTLNITLFLFDLKFLSEIFFIIQISVAVSLRFRKPEFRWFRTGLFVALGGSAIIPVLHAIILYGVNI